MRVKPLTLSMWPSAKHSPRDEEKCPHSEIGKSLPWEGCGDSVSEFIEKQRSIDSHQLRERRDKGIVLMLTNGGAGLKDQMAHFCSSFLCFYFPSINMCNMHLTLVFEWKLTATLFFNQTWIYWTERTHGTNATCTIAIGLFVQYNSQSSDWFDVGNALLINT